MHCVPLHTWFAAHVPQANEAASDADAPSGAEPCEGAIVSFVPASPITLIEGAIVSPERLSALSSHATSVVSRKDAHSLCITIEPCSIDFMHSMVATHMPSELAHLASQICKFLPPILPLSCDLAPEAKTRMTSVTSWQSRAAYPRHDQRRLPESQQAPAHPRAESKSPKQAARSTKPGRCCKRTSVHCS
jgi:hypothetical protein